MLIGLDCAEPSLVLERWRAELPVLDGLMERGTSGRLTSVIPPITVPAWSCMMSSRTPGDLGVYGFRNRADHTYDSLTIATSAAIREPRLWDLVTRAGKPSIVLGVPGTYPPRPLNGVMVSCFLTPSLESQYTYPATLRREVEAAVGEYVFDCTNFRTEDKDDLLRQVYVMTDRRFALAEHLLASKPWELFAMVEMGTDRMHHGFWKYMDPGASEARRRGPVRGRHPRLPPPRRRARRAPARTRRREHRRPRRLRSRRQAHGRRHPGQRVAPAGRAAHASRRAGRGHAARARRASTGPARWPGARAATTPASSSTSRAGSPRASSTPRTTSGFVATWRARLAAIPDEQGRDIGTVVYLPEEVYPQVRGIAPDLIVHFGDLLWRSVGTVGGSEGVHTFENDTGPDDANHAQDGLFVAAGPVSRPARISTPTCSTSPPPSSSSWESPRLPTCGVEASSLASRRPPDRLSGPTGAHLFPVPSTSPVRRRPTTRGSGRARGPLPRTRASSRARTPATPPGLRDARPPRVIPSRVPGRPPAAVRASRCPQRSSACRSAR